MGITISHIYINNIYKQIARLPTNPVGATVDAIKDRLP